ncbi:hypothetical protein FNJ87_07660 [Nonlabens mediterrranea]|uniref:YD repeat-containing protein n=1 Tax=Nonlabens mediterrranea TaxID=1419947 RepID=A0ABS0A6K0_9FLAO|nr:hypothetical protein [Nonlabens mediterrranea]
MILKDIHRYICILLLFTGNSYFTYGQTDNIKEPLSGEVKSVRVTIEFVNDSIQNLKLFSIDNDYGHTGFISPTAVKSNFNSVWHETTASRYLNYYQERDEKDRIIKELWLNKRNELVEDYRYFYNKNSKLTTEQDISEFEKNLIIDKYCDFQKYYFENNLLFKMTERDKCPKGEYFKTYIYDKNKRLVNKFRYSSYSDGDIHMDGELYHYQDTLLIKTTPYNYSNSQYDQGREYTYDEKHRMTKIYQLLYYKWASVDDTLKRIYSSIPLKKLYRTHEYNDNNNIVKEVFYNDDNSNNDSIIHFKTIERQFKNNLEVKIKTSYSITKDELSVSLIEQEFDDSNRIISYRRYYKNKLNASRHYSYNRQNDVISIQLVRNDELKGISKNKIDFKFKYDSHGNWVQQIKSVNGQPLFIWHRKIEYYN